MVHIEMVHIEIEVAVVMWYHTRALWFLHSGTMEHAARFKAICPRSSGDRAMASEAMRRRFDSYRGYQKTSDTSVCFRPGSSEVLFFVIPLLRYGLILFFSLFPSCP